METICEICDKTLKKYKFEKISSKKIEKINEGSEVFGIFFETPTPALDPVKSRNQNSYSGRNSGSSRPQA